MKIRIILAVVAIIGVGVLVNTVFYQALKDAAIRTVGVPVKISTGTVLSVRNFFGSFKVLADQREHSLQLQEKIKYLTAENAELRAVKYENEKLRVLLELKNSLKYETVAAEVVSREPFGLSGSITIDKGTEAGIKQGDPVIDGQGNLLGIIADVKKHSSNMTKLTELTSQVDAIIPDKDVLGLVVGAHGVGLHMEMVSQEVSIDQGSIVVTAGLDPTVPAGIIIGVVEDVSSEGPDLFKQISIKPAADLKSFKQVIVITDSFK